METVSIPLAALESPEYMALPRGSKMLLIDLYVLFHDTERFVIDIDRPADYRQSKGVWLPPRVAALVKAGLLVVDGRQKTDKHHSRRVFRFKYSALGELQEAA